MTPLDRLTGGRVPFALQHRARLAICQAVRGAGEIGACWRIGSNSYRPDPLLEAWTGRATPCIYCGDDEGPESWHHFMRCPSCGEEWVAGDYDWWKLGDVLRYRADLEAGLIDTKASEAPSTFQGFAVDTPEGMAAFRAECSRRADARDIGPNPPTWSRDRIGVIRENAALDRTERLRADTAGMVTDTMRADYLRSRKGDS